jgi:hypothetical protein
MIWTGVTASAETETSDVQETVQAIDAVAGTVRSDALDVSTADVTVAAAGTTVELSGDAGDGIMVNTASGGDLGIGLPFASQADAGVVVDGAVVYDNNNGSTTTPLVHQDGSVQILTTIADANAPTAYEYQFDLGQGATLKMNADGGVDVIAGTGATIASIAAPWAFDASGKAVPTRYETYGSSLIQVVVHRSAGVKYPVVADPQLSLGWWYYLHFNIAETETVAGMGAGAGSLTAMCALAGAPLGPVGAAALGVGCGVQAFSIVYNTGVAKNSTPEKCLYLKWRPLSGGTVYSGTYMDSRCK